MKILLNGDQKNSIFHMYLQLIGEFIDTFPDFIIQVRERTGNIKKYVIEVKPFKQTQPPQKGKKSKKLL